MLSATRLTNTPYPTPQLPHKNNSNLYILSNTSNGARPTNIPQRNVNRYQENIVGPFTNPSSAQPPTQQAPPTAAPPQTDIIGTILGDFGIFQLRSVLIIFLNKIPAAWFMACIIFTAPAIYPNTEFQCDKKDLWTNQTISTDQCYILERSNSSDIVVSHEKCTRFTYESSFQSLIMQFNLVCSRDILVAWTQFWHLFGVLLGGIIGTKLMIKFSPKRVYFIGMIGQIICGVITGYARDFTLHAAFRCIAAVFCAIMFTCGQAIFVDITGGKYRTGIIVLYDTFWSIGVILLPGLSSFFDDWTYIYLGITFPTVVLIFLLLWTPESPRWLLKNGSRDDVDRVERLIRNAAAINDRTFKIPEDFRQQLETLRVELQTQSAPAKWTELWRGHHRAKIHMVAAHMAGAFFLVNYMGMLLNLRSFGRDYLVPNTIAMGFAEIIGCFLAFHFTLKCDKRKYQYTGIFNIIAGGIGCLGWIFTGIDTMSPDLKVTLWMIIAVIPKAGVSVFQSLSAGNLAELMPANKKVPFMFSVVTWSRVWLLSAPFYNVLQKIDVALSLTSYSVFSILGGICTCLLLKPSSTPQPIVLQHHASSSLKKNEESPLSTAVWTVEDDVINTRL